MKNLSRALVIGSIVISSVFLFGITNVQAEDYKIVTVDSEKIAENSIAFKAAKKQIDKKREEYEAKSAKMQEVLINKFQDLEKRKNVISNEAYNKEREKNIEEAEKAQKTAYVERAALEQAYQNLISDFYDKVTEVIAKKAKERKAAIVLNKLHVFYSEEKLDVTDLIIEQLNKDLKTIEVKFNLANKS